MTRPSRAAGERPRAVAFVVLVVVGTALLQALWIAVVPPFRGTDEFDHAYRASAVASGQWRATLVPEDGRGLLVEASGPLVDAAHAQCASLSYTGPDNCTAAGEAGDGRVLVASGAANYHPAFYWVVGSAAEPFDGAAALYAMRVAGAALCLLLVGLAAWAVAQRRHRTWSGAGLALAMTPVLLFSTAVAAPNGLEMCAALALWSALLALDGSAPAGRVRGLLLVAIAAAVVLASVRMLGPLFLACLVAAVWALHPGLPRSLAGTHRRLLAVGVLAAGAATALAAWWVLSTGAVKPAPELQGGPWRWGALVLWPLQAIAAFPYRDQAGATIVYPVVLLLFGGLVAAALRYGGRRERVVLVLVVVASLAIPLALTAATYAGRGAMWQGRYGLPFSLGIVLVAAHVLDRRHPASRRRAGLIVIGGALMAVATAACLLKVRGEELARAVSATDPAWHPPSPALVVAGSCLAYALLTWAAVRTSRERA